MVKTLSLRITQAFKAAEWVCIVFILVSVGRLLLSGAPIPWGSLKLNLFPYVELNFLALAALAIRFREHSGRSMAFMLSLLVTSYYGFTYGVGENLVPVTKLLSPSAQKLFWALRWPTLIGFIFFFFWNRKNYKDTNRSTPEPTQTVTEWVRSVFPYFFMISLYPFTPLIIQSARIPDQDRALAEIDRFLFLGHDPHHWIENHLHPILTEWMAFSYSFYAFFILGCFGILLIRKPQKPLEAFILKSCIALAVGYTFYWLIPAQGPVFTLSFSNELDLKYLHEVKESLMDRTRVERDCFPSLHTALTLVCLDSTWRHIKPLFWVFLPMALTVPLACVYLRYHYVTDVIAGLVLSTLVIRLTNRYFR